MNSTNDIKVTFLNTAKHGETKKIRVFFKDIFNNDIQIDLRPGEIVYSQTNYMSNSLKIYSKKGIIEIKEERKPNFLKYYIGYKEQEIENKNFLCNLQNSLIEHDVNNIEEKTPTNVEVPEPKNLENEDVKTIVDKAIEKVSEYSLKELSEKKKKRKSRRGPGRPKKRGPKKGSKRKKMEE